MTKENEKLMRVVCRHCHQVLSHPLRSFSSDDRIRLKDRESSFDNGLILSVQEFRNRSGLLIDSFPADWVVHNESVVNCTPDNSTFGCCGCTPNGKANLMCRCGNLVGSEWSDCIDICLTVFQNQMVFIIPNGMESEL